MGSIDDLAELRAAVLKTIDRILLELYDGRMTGEEPPENFKVNALSAIQGAIAVADTMAAELREFDRSLRSLEPQIGQGSLSDQAAVIGQIEAIYERIWYRKIDLRSMLVRARNLGYQL